jgi:alkaline phosphatase D
MLRFKSFPLLFIAFTIAISGIYAQNDITRIALIGCHKQNEPAPALEYFADVLKPDFAIWLGDNVYADTDTDPMHILRQLEILEQKEGFQRLRATVPFFVTWDDHDYGLNNAGAEYIFKEESKHIFRKFWKLENEIPENHDGIYYASIETLPNGKTIQFLMVDGRFNNERYLPDVKKKEADILGENQWRWLENELKKPADVRLFVTGQQVLLNKMNRWEAWSKVGRSQERLDDLLARLNVNNLVFLTGDQHTAEVLKSLKKMKYKTFEIMACGINQTERPGRAPNRVAGPDKTLHSAPILEIHWDEQNPFIEIKNHDVENKSIGMQYKIFLSQIGVK